MTNQIQIPPDVMGIAAGLSQIDVVEAITVSGAQMASGLNPDDAVNMDIYARYAVVPLGPREDFVRGRSDQYELGVQGFPICDEWRERDNNLHIRLRYRDVGGVIDEIQRIMTYQEATLGNSTEVLHRVKDAVPIYDRGNWFGELQKTALQPYPQKLAYSIIVLNYAKLNEGLSSYMYQMETAFRYADWVALSKLCNQFLSSYFDVIFALNRIPNPNSSRMVDLIERACPKRPQLMREDVYHLLTSNEPLEHAKRLLTRLDTLLFEHRHHPEQLGL